ncbi:hypothetical protein [Bradyrhizobium sp. RDI18]|uniref:hypothetical protein n=1 Tax=Bradyrhizobium sp. RDI18 TaxID=3367400 RepID=UPI00371A08C5
MGDVPALAAGIAEDDPGDVDRRVIVQTSIGKKASIGSYARLRPGTGAEKFALVVGSFDQAGIDLLLQFVSNGNVSIAFPRSGRAGRKLHR